MKKVIWFCICLIAGFSLFAETYEVSIVIGKVYSKTEAGKWRVVKEGTLLTEESVIRIEEKSSLGLMAGGQKVIIRGPKTDSLDVLFDSKKTAGLGKGADVKRVSVAKGKTGISKGVSTAASRASESQGQTAWAEDEEEEENEE
ncbi:MAG: hypothetical protein MJ181_05610 [Treponema sp.]|nr:hypothetical protein [Treponema sp.]